MLDSQSATIAQHWNSKVLPINGGPNRIDGLPGSARSFSGAEEHEPDDTQNQNGKAGGNRQ
jgi:hypothetical protein